MTTLDEVSCADVGIDQARVDEVTAFMEEAVGTGTSPGIALQASRGGRVFLRAAWGDRLDEAACEPSIVFPYMSFSKAITSSVICQVQAGGGFQWDDLVVDYLPG